MSRTRRLVIPVAFLFIIGLLAATWLLKGRDSDVSRYEELVEMNAKLYEELKLGEPFIPKPNGQSFPEEDASVHAILEYCRSFDLPALKTEYAEDPAGTALLRAFADSCLHIDAPLLFDADEYSPYRKAFDQSLSRIEQALARYGGVPAQPYRRLSTWRNPYATQTPQEFFNFIASEAGQVYHFLRSYERGCGSTNPPSDCGLIVDFANGVEGTIEGCRRSGPEEAWRNQPSYDAQLAEPLFSDFQTACQILHQARETLGPPEDNGIWHDIVARHAPRSSPDYLPNTSASKWPVRYPYPDDHHPGRRRLPTRVARPHPRPRCAGPYA